MKWSGNIELEEKWAKCVGFPYHRPVPLDSALGNRVEQTIFRDEKHQKSFPAVASGDINFD